MQFAYYRALTEGPRQNNFAILGVEAPVWQDAETQEYWSISSFRTNSRPFRGRRQTGWIDGQVDGGRYIAALRRLKNTAGDTLVQPFVCNIPQVSLNNAALASPPQATRPYIYGHGLLGTREQANNTGHQAPMAGMATLP